MFSTTRDTAGKDGKPVKPYRETLSTVGSEEKTLMGKIGAKAGYLFDMFGEQSAQAGGVALSGRTEPLPKKK